MGKSRSKRVARRITREHNVHYTNALAAVREVLNDPELADEISGAAGGPDTQLYTVVMRAFEFH